MLKWFPLIVIFLLFYCSNKNRNSGLKPFAPNAENIQNLKRPNIWIDTSFHKLKCGLYINQNGELAYRSFDKPMCDTCYGGDDFQTHAYLCLKKNRIKLGDRTPEDYSYVPLKNIIDTASLSLLNELYFKDKSRVYFFSDFQEGGTILEVERADVNTFSVYKDSIPRCGFDKYYFYDGVYRIPKKEEIKYGLKRI
jgi:hypothetical protein